MSIQKITSLKTSGRENFFKGISFKGYTKQITASNGIQPEKYYGTDGEHVIPEIGRAHV